MNKKLIPFREKNKWGFCDEEKKVVVPCIYDLVRAFQEGIAPVMKDGLWGAISDDGQEVIQCIFENSQKINPLQFSEGLAVISVKEKYGYLDKTGEIIIDPNYEFAGWFIEDLACISVGKKYGFINKSGEIVIKCKYDDVTSFEDGLSIVFYKKKRGYINKNGVEFWED